MAEIILPPEENEETPQVPELNIDKPTENSKVITIEFEAKKTNKVSTKDTNQQLYTTDTDAWFEFKETSLEGASGTYSVVFRNRHDGSIFQRTGDVVSGVAYYKIPHQEIRHAGAWRGQIVYTLINGDTTAREFGYDVKGHILDGKDVREIVVEDFETLMSQLRSMKDNAESELAGLVNTANQNETNRQAFFDDLVEDIDDLQANYQELLDTGVLQTNINTKLEQLEEEYAPKLTEVTAQLAQTHHEATRKKELEDLSPNVLSAIESGEGTEFNLLSIPQDGSVTPIKTTFAKQGKNKFSQTIVKDRALRGSFDSDGLFVESSNQGIVSIDRIIPGTTYTASRKEGTSNRFRAATFTEYPVEHETPVNRFINPFDNDLFTFTAQTGDNWLVVSHSFQDNYRFPQEFQIEKGTSKTTYESPNAVNILFSSEQEFGNINPGTSSSSFTKKIGITHSLEDYNLESEYTNPYSNHELSELYDRYDDLMAEYPDYIFRTLLGTESTGLPIYLYKLKPKVPQLGSAGITYNFPKIIYVSCLHGMEKHAAFAGFKVFENVCKNWRENETLEAMRWGVEILIIPIANPYGYVNNQRKNSNGIDLNRNFTHGFVPGTDPTSMAYSGTSAASELETQILQNFINQNRDALFFIDHHNSGGWESQNQIIWTGSVSEHLRNTLLSGFNHFISSKSKKRFAYLPESESLQQLSNPVGGGLARYAHTEGIDSALLESSVLFQTDQDTQIFNTLATGNFFKSVLKYYS